MSPSLPERPRWKGFIAAGIVITCWTGFNIVSRLGGKSALTPFDITALRFGVSLCFILPVFFITGTLQRLPWPRLLPLACCGGLFYALTAYTGFSYAPAAHAGILINGGIPLATVALAWLLYREKPSRRSLGALAIAASGILILGINSVAANHVDSPREWIGDLCFIGAALLYANFGLLVRAWHIRPLDTLCGLTVGSALLYFPVYLLFLPKGITLVPLSQILLQGVYQGIIAALVASFSYAYATLSLGPGVASLMLAIVPGTSALLAVPFLGERASQATVAGVLLVTVGALLGALVKKTPRTSTPPTHSSD